jgi:hypothetical protein
MWKQAFAWALARASEPSTYAGIATAIASMGFLPHAQDYAASVVTWGAVASGAAAILLKEKK